MAKKRFINSAELVARGWHPETFRWYLGAPERTDPLHGDLYLIADVVVVEADAGWAEHTAELVKHDQERKERQRLLEKRQAALNSKHTALYRLFDAAGVLQYVGITSDLTTRFKDHRKEKPWWGDVASKTIEWFSSRPEARAAEDFAIVTEHPLHNKEMASEYDRYRYRHSWLSARLRECTKRPSTKRIDQHRVPFADWWSPCAACAKDRFEIFREADEEHQVALPAQALVRELRHRQVQCGSCGEAYPCRVIRKAAARFSNHPQYAPLWGPGGV